MSNTSFSKSLIGLTIGLFVLMMLFFPLNNIPILGSFVPYIYENLTGIFIITSNMDILANISIYAMLLVIMLVLLKKRSK